MSAFGEGQVARSGFFKSFFFFFFAETATFCCNEKTLELIQVR